MADPTIAVIGAGNMGVSIIGGLIKTGHDPDCVYATDTCADKLNHVQELFNIHVTTDNQTAIQSAEVVIFAIKPQVFHDVTKKLATALLQHKPLILSIAAGIRISNIEAWLGGDCAIIRAMPNTPALIGCGATALYANAFVNASQRQLAETLMQALGQVVWLEQEALMDAVTALSGSGPAYFFLVMEAMEQAGIALGLSKEVAHLLTLQTALGAAQMAIDSTMPLSELRQRVTSPGGTTEKAVSVLETGNIRKLFFDALDAAKQRSESLAR